jgi:hypothetical protein
MLRTNICMMNVLNQVMEDELDRARRTHGEKRNAYMILARNPKGQTTRKTRRSLEDTTRDSQ